MNKNEIINNIIAEYAEKLSGQKAKIDGALKKARGNKSFAALEKEIAAAEIETARAEADGRDCAAENRRLETLYAQKDAFLKDNGLFTELKYSCPKCRDSGWNGGELCGCIKQRLHDEIIKEGGLPYSAAVFGKKAVEIFGPKVQPEMSKLYKNLEKYCADIGNKETKSILIAGNTGVGKTHLLCCMANALMDKGCTVQFLTAFAFNSVMLKYVKAPTEEKDELLAPLLDTDALFIDDLGAEIILNNVTIEYLYLIINERQLNGKYIFISTNLGSDELLSRYGARIHSRLMNKSTSFFVTLPGEDLRKMKQ